MNNADTPTKDKIIPKSPKIGAGKGGEFKATKTIINLLPSEMILQKQYNAKISLINKGCVVILVLLVIMATATLSLRFTQNLELNKLNNSLATTQSKVNSLQDKEAEVSLLKKRLNVIGDLLNAESKSRTAFTSVVGLIPTDVGVSEISADKNGNMVVSLTSPSLLSIDKLIKGLANYKETSGAIAQVDLNGISLGKDSVYRFNLQITGK